MLAVWEFLLGFGDLLWCGEIRVCESVTCRLDLGDGRKTQKGREGRGVREVHILIRNTEGWISLDD